MKTKRPPPLEIAIRAPDQLGQAVGRFRAKAELSQSALAKSAGMRQATISKVEKGLGTTEVQTIFAVCAALGLELVLRPRNSGADEFRPEDVFAP
ncbi:helix-turn-helix domain-containing protein [Bdellovibrionota bacterium FG-1]